jgi:hypothetical protein
MKRKPRPKAGLKVCVWVEKSSSRRETLASRTDRTAAIRRKGGYRPCRRQGLLNIARSGCVFSVTTTSSRPPPRRMFASSSARDESR